MELRISGPLAGVIVRRARERGLDVEQFLAEAAASGLDPEERVELYVKLSEKYLREAEELYARGDLPRAGEKYWGAVTALLNAVAERRGWPHYSHRDYVEIVERLADEARDHETRRAMDSAEKLHANLYHGFLSPRGFEERRKAALDLVERLRGLLGG